MPPALNLRPFWALALLAAPSCVPPGDGIQPPRDRIYFPVGIVSNPERSALFVVNSDFDLQFNAGVVQSLSLPRLRQLVPTPCEQDADCEGEQRCDTEPSSENGGMASYLCVAQSGPFAGLPCGAGQPSTAVERVTVPGPCQAIDPARPIDGGASLIQDSVIIGAFATDVIFRERPEDAVSGPPGRLFIPVRGDTTLHYIDVEADGRLDCGQANREDGSCDAVHRVGDDEPEQESPRDLRLETEPFGLDATADGRAVLVTHQTQGVVSLFVNDWNAPPRLEFALGNMPSRVVGIAAVPQPDLGSLLPSPEPPGFLVTFRNRAEVRLLQFFDDGLFDAEPADQALPFIASTRAVPINVNSLGVDSRGIAVDASERERAQASCSEDQVRDACAANPVCPDLSNPEPEECLASCVSNGVSQCLRDAAAVPVSVYVANRTPASLVLGRTQAETSAVGSTVLPAFYDSVPLTAGPSRVVVGEIIDETGQRAVRVFVICFDSRLIFIYDPETQRIETQIETGRGPYGLVTDPEHGIAYVAHFTDSYLGVIGIDQRFPRAFGKTLANIGIPTAPRATK